MVKGEVGKYSVKTINDKPVAEAIVELRAKATEKSDTHLLAQVEELEKIDFNNLTFRWDKAETREEATEGFTDEDLVDTLNVGRKNLAKSKAYQKLLAPFKPDPNDPEVKRQQLLKMASAVSPDAQREMLLKIAIAQGVDPATAAATLDAMFASATKV